MADIESGQARSQLTCVLVEDHPDVLASLASLLRLEGLTVVGQATTGAEALRLLEHHQPDLAVIDARLPDMNGIEIARIAANVTPSTALVIHTAELSPEIARAALEAGVRGVALKAVPPTHLLRAISSSLSGEVYVDPGYGRLSVPSCL